MELYMQKVIINQSLNVYLLKTKVYFSAYLFICRFVNILFWAGAFLDFIDWLLCCDKNLLLRMKMTNFRFDMIT